MSPEDLAIVVDASLPLASVCNITTISVLSFAEHPCSERAKAATNIGKTNFISNASENTQAVVIESYRDFQV
jgi:hypothetical protein